MMRDKDSGIFLLLAEISKNVEDEHEAIAGYHKLLYSMTKDVHYSDENYEVIQKAIKEIKHIISEELAHSETLLKIAEQLSGILPEERE